jgi:hypothetical protein
MDANPVFAPDHWRQMAEFCKAEMAVGGPDPHMKLIGHMSRECSWEERVWRGGCYVGVYNVPAAEKLWTFWSPDQVHARPAALATWLAEYWAGLPLRRERRSVKSPEKLAYFLQTFALWLAEDAKRTIGVGVPYETAWNSVQTVYALGRYSAIKLLQYFYLFCEYPRPLYDIRAPGGWSPREALTLLFPERTAGLTGDDSFENIVLSEATAITAQGRFAKEFGLALDFFHLQVLLCDYKQSWSGRRQYPGRSNDSELEYHGKVAARFGPSTNMFTSRQALFPKEALGEIQGWAGVRKELGTTLRDHGYTWSDMTYDYTKMKDLDKPVRR